MKTTRAKLLEMTRERGMKGFWKLKKFELAEMLGIELAESRRRKPEKPGSRKPRKVKVDNLDGTTTAYPSICSAAKALEKYPMQLYTMAANGDVKFLN